MLEEQRAPAPTGRQLVIVSLGHGMLMVLGAVLALLVAQRFGKTGETDAFFAAYAFYGVGITLVPAFRLTAIAPLVADRTNAAGTRMLGAVAVITLVMAIPMVVFAGTVGTALVESDPTGIAADTLRILWLTLAGQMFAAMLAALLAVRGAFVVIGVASLLAGVVSVSAFLLVAPALGILAAAVGLAASAGWLTACSLVAVLRTGWRPAHIDLAAVHGMFAEAGRLAYASATFFGATLLYLLSIAIAARLGEGEATLFAYAFMIANMLVGVTSNVTAMVRSPALLESDERSADVAAAGVWSFRFTVVLVGPVLAMTVLVGGPLIGFALGSGYDDADVNNILVTVAVLSGWILASAAAIFAVVELLARGELRRLLALTVAQVVALTLMALAGAAWIGIEGIAAASSIALTATAVVLLAWAFGESWRGLVGEMARATGRELVVLASSFGPAAALLLTLGATTGTRLAAAALAAVLVAAASYFAWPREAAAVLALVHRAHAPGPALAADR